MQPNHVLINEYHPDQGIMPHCDGPLYDPLVAILSLGSSVVFDFWKDGALANTITRAWPLPPPHTPQHPPHRHDRLTTTRGSGNICPGRRAAVQIAGPAAWFAAFVLG